MSTSTITKGLGWLCIGLLIACLTLAVGMWHFYSEYQAKASDYSVLVGKVEQQNAQATFELDRLTKQRDQLQAERDNAYRQREAQDAIARLEMDRLERDLANQPVRVRYIVSDDSGSGGCSSGSQEITAAVTGGRSRSTATGLLSAEADRSLKQVIGEVERLNAAYTSCRAELLSG